MSHLNTCVDENSLLTSGCHSVESTIRKCQGQICKIFHLLIASYRVENLKCPEYLKVKVENFQQFFFTLGWKGIKIFQIFQLFLYCNNYVENAATKGHLHSSPTVSTQGLKNGKSSSPILLPFPIKFEPRRLIALKNTKRIKKSVYIQTLADQKLAGGQVRRLLWLSS